MAKILLSLAPLAEARWEKSPATGAEYLVAPLSSERDADLQRECADMMGNVNLQLFAEKVCLEVLKGWKGIGDGKSEGELPCNPENVKAFVKWHGQGEGQFVLRRARSLAHFVAAEVEEAKKG